MSEGNAKARAKDRDNDWHRDRVTENRLVNDGIDGGSYGAQQQTGKEGGNARASLKVIRLIRSEVAPTAV